MKSVVLVTGASTGIAALTARTLARAGHTVYASMRHAARVRAGCAMTKAADVRFIEIDALSQTSADRAIERIVHETSWLDVIVHHAGPLAVGPTEAFTSEEIQRVFDANVLGPQRINRAALPYLRAQRSGLLLWISSTAVRGGFPPFVGPHAAAKAAMESLAVSLACEVARFGIETSMVGPDVFTEGTTHFPSVWHPADVARASAYTYGEESIGPVTARLRALTPDDAQLQRVADEVTRIVGLPPGTRPARASVDAISHGTEEYIELAPTS